MKNIEQVADQEMTSGNAMQIDAEIIRLAIHVCVVTASEPTVLTKTRRLDEITGTIITEKNGNYPAGALIKGYAENSVFKSMREFAQFLDTAKMNQALIGAKHTATTDSIQIMSRTAYRKAGEPANAITRTKDNFYRPAGEHGLLILDCDSLRTSKEQFIAAIKTILPLDSLAYAYTTSSSSFLSVPNKIEGELKGQRLYIVLKDASHTTEAGENLFKRLWLEGHGWYEAGAAGQYLNRGIIDTAMFKDTCRLDFVSGSNCIAPVVQQRPPAEFNDGEPLDSRALLCDLTSGQLKELEAIQGSARDRIANEIEQKKAAYCDKKGRENLAKQGITEPTTEQLDKAKTNVLKALDSSSLTGDFVITLAKDRKQITIADALSDPERYDQADTLDPLEPEYNNYHAVGKLYLMEGRPTLHTFAHGGKVYRLFKQSRFIQHANGSTAETTNDTLALMRIMPNYFDMGGQLVAVKGGRVVPMTEHLLSYELGSIAQYYIEKTDKKGNVLTTFIDPPSNVVRQIMSMNAQTGNGNTQRGLKPLKAVITAPTITADNHVVYKRGYDADTCLYLATSDEITPPASNPTIEEITAAYRSIMDIIDTFKLKNDIDKSVVLSAFLTAVIRPAIDKAPIYALDAPTKGSGKTYLAECIGALALGHEPTITPAIQGDEAEINKTLLSMLMNNERVIIWDNIMGSFNSAKFAAFTTAPVFGGRVLGVSQMMSLPNKAMVIFTGNNLSLYGDLPRRCITARIDTGEENPLDAHHDLTKLDNIKPDTFILRHRQRLAMACITIIRAYLTGANGDRLTTHKVGSFEEWDKLTRQPVIYLAQLGIDTNLHDVKASIDKNMAHDPEHELLTQLLDQLSRFFGNASFTAKDVMNIAYDFVGEPAKGDGADLAELIADIVPRNNRPNTRTMGRIISNRLDCIADGKKIVELKGAAKQTKRYQIATV